MLRISNLHVSIGLVKILHDISFNLENGECVALLGSNGSGKSTTLKVISGIVKPKSGDIWFSGKRINDMNPGQRVRMGIIQVQEGGRVFPYLSVMENLLLGASGDNNAWKSRKKTMEWMFSLFPILKVRGSLPARSLSGGERQMLAIGRGLMAEPKLMMIDEPSLGLSPKILLEIYSIMKSLRDQGMTILLSEQNVQKALGLANRAYILENGRIVMQGPSNELLGSKHVRAAYLGI
jgi:branched-chain amino acid transport system ATP-binding protein